MVIMSAELSGRPDRAASTTSGDVSDQLRESGKPGCVLAISPPR
jgi:hypothetical protein